MPIPGIGPGYLVVAVDVANNHHVQREPSTVFFSDEEEAKVAAYRMLAAGMDVDVFALVRVLSVFNGTLTQPEAATRRQLSELVHQQKEA